MNIIREIKDENESEDSKKTTFMIAFIVVEIVIIISIYFFFYYGETTTPEDDLLTTQAAEEIQNTQDGQIYQENMQVSQNNVQENQHSQIATTFTEIENNSNVSEKNQTSDITTEKIDTIKQLKYTIKPLDKNIASCSVMSNGKWQIPSLCETTLIDSIKTLINDNNEIIAIEVSGIVDNNPYSAPSAELKQEGLASFRAREAIRLITRNFSNIAVFEGLSIQAPDTRGFKVRAYYLQK